MLGEKQNDTPLAYDEFGVPVVGEGKSINQPFGFTGYQTDDISGIHTLALNNATAVPAVREVDFVLGNIGQGLLAFFILDGKIYYRF